MSDKKLVVISLSKVAAGYQTRVSVFTFVGGAPERIITANPNRWAIRFATIGLAAFTIEPTPGPMPANPISGTSGSLNELWKFPDCPSWVTGEWYAEAGAASQLMIWECIKVE